MTRAVSFWSVVSLLFWLPNLPLCSADWSLHDALHAPGWLHISGEQRTRYETIDEQFRAGEEGSDQMLALRTSLVMAADLDRLQITAEILDARQYLADSGSYLDTTMVNAFELLQGYLEWNLGSFAEGNHYLRLGRETLDLGNRRLIARNSFRNTINAFTGVDWRWEKPDGTSLRAVWFLPNQRSPFDEPSMEDNQIAVDDQDFDLQLWAIYATFPLGWKRSSVEFYTFGLHESGPLSRHRQLYTPGLRLVSQPAVSSFDFELESAYQFGTSSMAINDRQLQHRAHLQHISLGYTFDVPATPRLSLAYDYVSGDRDPSDGSNNRFDTLYGARRFEYGPTGLYGAIPRSNISSPEIRLSLKPVAKTEFAVAYRGVWLASSTDAWVSASVRDSSGKSGNFVGQQLEARLRWDVLPNRLRVETGIAQLVPGSYLDRAPNGHPADTTYSYFEMTWRF